MRLPQDGGNGPVPLPEVKMRTLRRVNLGQVEVQSIGAQLWTHHIENTRAYAEAALAGNTPAAVSALKQLWQAVLDWQKLTGSDIAGALMGEHTVYAKLLADCFAGEIGSACATTAADAVGRNVESVRALFPVEPERFADLFGVHSTLAGQYITDLAAGDMASFNIHFLEALTNGKELADFTDQVILRPVAPRLSGPRSRRMGQVNYITTDDFRAYVTQANSSMKAIADIARAYDLSAEELQAINSELGKVSGFTVPMAQDPKCGTPSPSLLPLLGIGLLGVVVGSVV